MCSRDHAFSCPCTLNCLPARYHSACFCRAFRLFTASLITNTPIRVGCTVTLSRANKKPPFIASSNIGRCVNLSLGFHRRPWACPHRIRCASVQSTLLGTRTLRLRRKLSETKPIWFVVKGHLHFKPRCTHIQAHTHTTYNKMFCSFFFLKKMSLRMAKAEEFGTEAYLVAR